MERIDKYLAQNDFSSSREQAKREILAGWVKINGETCRDTSRKVDGSEEILIARPKGIFVSRGGYKLEKALDTFSIELKQKIVVDLGASTGGFTDCMLKRGAAKVYAIDVGYGQLDYRLRQDDRVVVMERTNARALVPAQFGDDTISFVSADLSFISFVKVFPVIKTLFPVVEGVALIKPQFEADRSEHKKGVIRAADIHINILERTIAQLQHAGCKVQGMSFSPVTGPKGNIEFLLHYSTAENSTQYEVSIERLVHEAWSSLK